MLEAFAAQSAQLTQSTTDWSQLKASAAGGQLRMEPGVAERAAQRCEAMVATLDGRYRDAQFLVVSANMGDCVVGNQLRDTFNNKATGGTNSLISVIAQHQQILTDMAATYRAAGAAFAAQESTNVNHLGGSA